MAANVNFLIFAHGNILYGEEGASYDREPLRKIRVKTDASYVDLLNAICTKVDIDPSAHQIKVLHRHPKSVGERVHHYLVPIQDDSDVEDLTIMAEKMGYGSIQEMYLEISNRSIGLSEHETRQVDAAIPATTHQVPRSKRDPVTGHEDSLRKRPRYDIDSSNDINNTKQEITRAPEDSPTAEMGENLVVADLRNEDPSQDLMMYKLHDPTAFPMPPSPVLMDITSGMEEGNQRSRPSSSTTPRGQDYEVFISFRGKDTRYGFTDHLYNGLVNAGVLVFRDNEELRVGKEIGPELLEAITGSKISVPIISKNYGSSIWCLNELVEILKCMKTSGQIVLPIFYQVEPSEVRNQKGDFGNGFLLSKEKHDAEGRLVQDWKNALVEVASLKAWESSKIANGHEGELVKMVVHKVLQVLRKVNLLVSDYLVGVEDHAKKIIEWITAPKGSSDVHAIVIHGMGGIGKTTLAKFVYNRLCNDFEYCSFIANIREESLKGMEALQMQLILQILGQKLDVKSTDEGVNIIKTRCNRKKALILLDDIENIDQLDALAGKPDWFGRGTVIIITSRRKDILKKWEGSYSYELNGLDQNQSFKLFCKHAFRSSDSIPDEYKTISMEIVSTTGGLPLAIEVIGSLLYDSRKHIWEANLKMLKEIPHDDVQHKLKISFDALNPDEKEIFLDIACLPIRTESELAYAIFMWDRCGFQPKARIEKLISLSLIKISANKGLIIHDQLRDLGREMVRREDINNLGKRSRLWKKEEALEVLESKQETPNVRALSFPSRYIPFGEGAHCTSQQFEGMKRLRFLHMQRVQLTGNFEDLFLNLRWLWWGRSGCIDIVGINFKPKGLVVLQLDNCNVTEHWTGWREMKYLKVLELRNCHELKTTLDFSAMEELDVLVLSQCDNLREIDSSIGKLSKSLKVLDVSHCRKLKKLPKEVGKMEELRKLDISKTSVREIPIFEGYLTKLETLSAGECCMLTELPKSKLDLRSTRVTQLPDSVGDLCNLEELSMSGSEIECLPTSIGKLHKLQKLDLGNCKELREIPESIGKLKLLTKLELSGTRVTQLPDSVGDLHNLEELAMSGSKIECLPTSIGNLHKLQELDLDECEELREIPESIGKLKLLTKLDLSSTRVTQLPESVGDLCNLEELSMSGSKIECLPTSIGNLHKLPKLNLCYCEELREIPESIGKLKLLTKLDLSSTRVTQLPESVGDLCNLEDLSMSGSEIECLPTSIGNLHKLPKLNLCYCEELREIPESIGKLKLLTKLDLRSTRVTQLPDSVGDLCNLEELSMSGSKIECLPTSIGNLHKLQKLDLGNCEELREIPESIRKLKLLTKLDLRSTRVTQLPDSVGDLCNLEELSMSGSKIECLPTSIGNLHKLQKLDLEGCKELESPLNLPCSLTFISFNGDSMEILPDLSNLTNLKYLTYKDLFQRRGRELNLGKLNQLKQLNIHDSKLQIHKIDRFPDNPLISVFNSEEGIDMAPENFRLLIELPLSVEQLEVIGCQTLCTLPNLSTLKNLFRLHLQKCSQLQEINGLEGAELLINVHIAGCHPEIKIPDLSMLRNLKHLTINNDRLTKIPWLQELKSLECLDISRCKSLKYLPDLSQLAYLQSLDIRGCTDELRMSLDLPRVKITFDRPT